MKKNIVMSAIALLLCFLLGYAAFQTAFLLRTWITESVGDCRSDRDPNCNENAGPPAGEFDGR
jgi:hypothetical protein